MRVNVNKEEKRKGKDGEREHRRRHHNSDEYVSFDRDFKESPSHKPGNDRKKRIKKGTPNGSIFRVLSKVAKSRVFSFLCWF